MFRSTSNLLTAGLLGSGVVAWALAGRPLADNPDLDVPLNPLGINGSPYGEVFAMAMQGPIDAHFHGVIASGATHRHAAGESCDSCDGSGKQAAASLSSGRLEGLLASMQTAVETRTNPKAASEAHKRFLRRQIEDKLRFAYQLDPSHYANYNSLHFFLTEPQLGTRPQLTPSAAKLAEETIQYCLRKEDDPRAALTAAAATSNILELMFNDRLNAEPKFTTLQMRQYLSLLDHCIGRYMAIARKWEETRNWELLSPQRVQECEDRIHFILKFREAADGAIARFEGKPHPSQAAN